MLYMVIAGLLITFYCSSRKASRRQRHTLLMLWLVVPPVYFFFEYYLQKDTITQAKLDRFRDLQSLATNVWIGIGLYLAILDRNK